VRIQSTTDRRLVWVWALLLALTLGSLVLGIEQSPGLATVAAVIIVGVAMIKVRLIGAHFMDLRVAPRPLRWIFDGYVLAVFLVLSALDLAVTS
jgi:hypothetical protein